MNYRRFLTIGVFSILVALGGCVVYVDDYPPRRHVYVYDYPPPGPAPEMVVSEDDEVHYVVYREYFGCTEEEIALFPYYRRYYGLSYDDIYFISYVGCSRGIGFEACFRSYYYDCGRNYDRLVIAYNVPRATFFYSANVAVTAYPPIYQRTYVAYRENTLSQITIQNHEYAALVQMKVGVDYQGHEPAAFFSQVNAHGGNPGKVIIANRDMCGRGGVSSTGARVSVVAQRPWTLPPAQKQAWHQQQAMAVSKRAEPFKSTHRDQVQKVQAQQRSRNPGDNPHHQGQDHAHGMPSPPRGDHAQGEEKKEK